MYISLLDVDADGRLNFQEFVVFWEMDEGHPDPESDANLKEEL